jgi:hypothetical protein
MSSHDDVLELMRECRSFDDRGRPVYWPVPPRLMLSLLTSTDPEYQGLGWMLFHTVAWRPVPAGFHDTATFPHRTAFAADALGRALGTKDLANFFRPRWGERKARDVWHRMDKARGWVEKRDGKLYLRGDCPCRFPVVSEDGPADPAPIDPVDSYLSTLQTYQVEQITKLPRAQQETLVANLKSHEKWSKAVQADAMMAARDETEPTRHRIFEAYGILVKTCVKNQAAREHCSVQLQLFDEPQLSLPLERLQPPTAPPPPVNGHAKNGHVPAPVQLPSSGSTPQPRTQPHSAVLNLNGAENPGYPTDAKTPPLTARTADTHTPREQGRQAVVGTPERDGDSRSAPPNTAEVYTVLQVMRRFAQGADDDAAAQLIRACRANSPKCSPVQIAEALEVKGPLAKGKESPAGFLIVAVPKLFKGAAGRMAEENGHKPAATPKRPNAEVRDATPEEIEEYKSRGAYVSGRRA